MFINSTPELITTPHSIPDSNSVRNDYDKYEFKMGMTYENSGDEKGVKKWVLKIEGERKREISVMGRKIRS
jgi:hypothetical protein